MAIGRFSVRCNGRDGSGRRCAALGPDADTIDDAGHAAGDAGWQLTVYFGVARDAYCPACARRDVVAARAGDGVAGGAWGT